MMTEQRTRVTRLPMGLTVASAPMAGRASVSVGLWVGVGARHETARDNGVCHFIEHMLFKGTRRRSAEAISQAVEGVGGYLNAFTGEEGTCFYARARHDQLELLLDVLSDMLLHSRFTPEEVERERGVIQEEIAMYLDQPQQHVQELLNGLMWPEQPMGRPLTGTVDSVNRLKREDLMAFHRAHFRSGATFLVAAGAVHHERLVALASRLLRGLPQGPRSSAAPVQEGQTRPAITLCTKNTEQTQIVLGLRALSRHDPRRYALRLLNTLLGENMSSRLFQIVREDHGLAYSIYSSHNLYADTGLFTISAGLDADNVTKVLRLVLGELARLRRRAPGKREFGRARDYVLGQLDLGLENTENRMQWVGEQLLGDGRVVAETTLKRRLSAVTPREVAVLARELFRPERANLALVSPLKSAVGLRRELVRGFD